MQERFLARLKIIGAVFFFYFLPWMVLAFYTGSILAPAERWAFLSIALFVVLFATLLLVVCIHRFENTIAIIVKTDHFLYASLDDPSAKYGSQDDQSDTDNSLDAPYSLLYEETLQQLKKEQAACEELQEQIKRQQQQHEELESTSQAEKAFLHAELEEERERAENRQKQIIQLEVSARDLKYEIKTLVESTGHRLTPANDDLDVSSLFPTRPLNSFLDPVSTLSSAESQLKLCVSIAQKFTGARHLTQSLSRFQDPSIEGYDLDLRRLTDTLLSVTGRPILLYQRKEGRLLFVSPQIKQLLGWSAEKYLQDFTALFPEGQDQWEEYLRQLPLLGYIELNKTLMTNVGEPLPTTFHLGWIPAGIFKAHIIGLMEKVPQLVS